MSGVLPPTAPPEKDQQQAPVSDVPDDVYEVIITAMGTLEEQAVGGVSAAGPVRVIQGPRTNESPADGVFGFLSVDTLNVPLVSTSRTSRVSPGVYCVRIPGKEFLLTLDPRTEPAIVEGMEQVLQWFTAFEGDTPAPGDVTEKGQRQLRPAGADGAAQPAGVTGAIDRAGLATAAMVMRAGKKLHESLDRRVEASLAGQANKPAKNVKLGGAPTAAVLTSARKVADAGAGAAATVVDKLSSAIGNKVANSSAMSSARAAPEGSMKKQTHDLLVAGAVAVARVYVAADDQAKTLFTAAGDGAGRIAGAKYGAEAEHAARSVGGIGVDGYRIFRFPEKLGVSLLVKGVAKGVAPPPGTVAPPAVPPSQSS
ncbi:unnamed protein product [Sphacelaria rigidula]